jgi:hypothetical protein
MSQPSLYLTTLEQHEAAIASITVEQWEALARIRKVKEMRGSFETNLRRLLLEERNWTGPTGAVDVNLIDVLSHGAAD